MNSKLRKSMCDFDRETDRLEAQAEAVFERTGHGPACAGCGSTEDAHNVDARGRRYCDECWATLDGTEEE